MESLSFETDNVEEGVLFWIDVRSQGRLSYEAVHSTASYHPVEVSVTVPGRLAKIIIRRGLVTDRQVIY